MKVRQSICIRGLSLHNLKEIDLDIPHNMLVAVTGVSGAGKSSLVFDAIYAESQRRFIETFSPYARQFLERLPRPSARIIENLPAAISIGQKNPVRNARSTVATLAELTWPARLLFYHLADLFCPKCGRPVISHAPVHVASEVMEMVRKGAESLLLTVKVPEARAEAMAEQGWFRYLSEGKIKRIEPGELPEAGGEVEFIIDRFKLPGTREERIMESAEQAFALGSGRVYLVDSSMRRIVLSSGRHCSFCDLDFPAPTPALFSFNSSAGACPECTGFGRIQAIDPDLVVPDPRISIEDGAVRPLETRKRWKARLIDACREEGIDIHIPYENLSEEDKRKIFSGFGTWRGVDAFFKKLEQKRYKPHIRMLLARYRTYLRCPSCKGSRFRPETLCYRLGDLRLPDFYDLAISDAVRWCEKVRDEKRPDDAALALLNDLHHRLDTLARAGLSYLSLSRASRTLSGGEAARINMARALSSRLSNTLYCIDEPSTGLHPSDTRRFARILEGLVQAGNTVLVVDNDPEIVRASEMVIELGPGSGSDGGRVIFQGAPEKSPSFMENSVSDMTVSWGDGSGDGAFKGKGRKFSFEKSIGLYQVSEHNLDHIDVSFPVGAFTTVSGVSGSGKSTLAEEVLFRAVSRRLGRASERPGAHRSLVLPDEITFCELVDQSPPSRTPRACAATALKILDPVRKLLASTEEAKEKGLSAGAFSFNTAGGRCEECAGQGSTVVEMQFLPDITLPCPECRGRRFGKEVLSVRYRGLNIADILELTISDALDFFSHLPAMARRMKIAHELGLGHLRLGQPLSVLSAGEIQRLKLSLFLQKGSRKGRGLFILDEPTRGLHGSEVRMLVSALKRLSDQGHTVVVVEHDLQVIAASDWVIDLGPGGGDAGGRVVLQGTPSLLAGCTESATGRMLASAHTDETGVMEVKEQGLQVGYSSLSSSPGHISIRGARHHNLKNISVEIPHNRIVVITGVSGSGKSTLAFDCIFSEGQRRYVEGLSSYMRQFISMYQRPDADSIRGLTPSVAIEQRTSRAGAMSTVATLTETAHYLRLLYARVAQPWCPKCGVSMAPLSADAILGEIVSTWGGQHVMIAAPVVTRRKGMHREVFETGIKMGIETFLVDGRLYDRPSLPVLARYEEHSVSYVVADLRVSEEFFSRIKAAVQRASELGNGVVMVLYDICGELPPVSFYSTVNACPICRRGVQEPDPLLFSFSTKAGRCPKCRGSGRNESAGPCETCRGSRLNEHARSWRIGTKSIADLFDLEIEDAFLLVRSWLETSPWPEIKDDIARPLVKNVAERLGFLRELGLHYLPLGFPGDALSGGEAQRIRLAAQAGSGLSGVTVVLDEPTIGLHPKDNQRLINAFRRLKEAGNSVIVVEHDEETLRAADWIVDLGPGGGSLGGEVVVQGTPKDVMACERSATGAALRDSARRSLRPCREVREDEDMLELKGITFRNLKGFDIHIPKGAVTVVTGVSGAGKSTLVSEVLAPAAETVVHGKGEKPFSCSRIGGAGDLSRVVTVDHSPIGRTPRSCPATYIGVWTEIRALLSRVPQARNRGFGPGRFSFNLEGGRCSVCSGQGSMRVSLGYLPDVFVPCEECGGSRFEPATLEVRWKEKNVSEILAMTLSEAREFFRAVPRIVRYLSVACDLGLGYLTLGQPAPTLSGGEAQRLKLSKELATGRCENSLYLLDEPTIGLHMKDVALLTRHLQKFAMMGSTVVVIEHNLDLIASADWIIELGPGGGRHGGNLLFCGTPADFLHKVPGSPTASALSEYLQA